MIRRSLRRVQIEPGVSSQNNRNLGGVITAQRAEGYEKMLISSVRVDVVVMVGTEGTSRERGKQEKQTSKTNNFGGFRKSRR